MQELIAGVYDAIGLPMPSVESCIAPLNRLVRGYELTQTEIAGLTSKAAAHFLMRRSGVEPAIVMDETPLAGFLYVSRRFGCIFVEQRDPIVRRRFSIAHELGHYFLHFRPLLNELADADEPLLIEATDAFPTASDDVGMEELPESKITINQLSLTPLPPIQQMELEANEFAAELLMPEATVKEKVNRLEGDLRDEALVGRLAADMLVSGMAMQWRLRALGLWQEERRVN